MQKMKFYSLNNIKTLPQYEGLPDDLKQSLQVVSQVLPFRANNYVCDELIDWDNVPDDPIFQLTFMQKDMLTEKQYRHMERALRTEDKVEIAKTAAMIREELNPHPAGQMEKNVPRLEGEVVPGVQHKYKETALVFPKQGQTCFAYCTFCFRWAQFIGDNDLKFATDNEMTYQNYLAENKVISDVLFTGGDPMIMGAKLLDKHLAPFTEERFDHIQNIRIGTKALGYWPYRFTTDKDADDILKIFEKLVAAGKHVALMAHFNHPVELSTPAVKEAIKRIRATGAEIRTQSPVLNQINNDPKVWTDMWRDQVKLGCIPYYMFVERDTGARSYFEIPLVEALDIYREAIQNVSGLARTARGPSMSATPGKVCVEGVAEIKGEKVLVLNFLQGRESDWIKRPFFAKYDEKAVWLNDLKPAFGERQFFFEIDEAHKIASVQ